MAEIILELKNLTDQQAAVLLKKHNLGLTVAEARKIETEILHRPITLTEATVWSIEGSEHCSYKSSRQHLKQLPTEGPNVILGPKEDAGIVEIATYNGERIGIVMSHESHNHPSQIVPYEGAATGIGGNVRDVCCMGARVIAVADPLRFGDISLNKSKWVASGVVSGIGGYGNPIGIPNLAGDVYFSSGFNENCLVNVVTLGLVKESEIIHSSAPKGAGEGNYQIILVGKPTDNSGFGGASFASFELDEKAKEKNKGAVQEPNAFLKRHLLESTYDLFKILKEKKLINQVGFKDLGAGGVLCASVELADSGGYGAQIEVDKIHVGMANLPTRIVLCSETQERFMWIASPEVAKLIVEHYNTKWALPKVSAGAQASIIGKVTVGGQYTAISGNEKVVDAKACDITEGLRYDRPVQEIKKSRNQEIKIEEPKDYNEVLLKILGHENIASRDCVYEKYDKTVRGLTVIEPGAADAGVMSPLLDEEMPEEIKNIGIALAVDSNPFYSRISPYWGAVNSVVEACRNVAAVGAMPWAITDCLNYGNPEKPEQMWQFTEGVRGVAEACKNIHLKSYPASPLPVISGNVSLYNEANGQPVDPSAIIACLGKLPDYHKAITMEFKQADSAILLIGQRKDELGGSVYYQLHGELGANVPQPNFKEVENQIYAVTDLIDAGLLLSCHDISDGGLAVAISEMCFGGNGKNRIGCEINLDNVATHDYASAQNFAPAVKLFSETGGFVLETKNIAKVKDICQKYNVEIMEIGKTTVNARLTVGAQHVAPSQNFSPIDLLIEEMANKWLNGLRDKLNN
ncbi:MAG: phosphoribosylformylglycinamidine synthase subunit PurL [Candidatus Komeilibacteria bacterium]|nr:phosphoribosylformylglycinamidine synthase subunit PurL [Candidatus Komeilibacteria bacterium]